MWGFEYTKKEINRAIRHGQQYPDTNPLFPLIEKGLDKKYLCRSFAKMQELNCLKCTNWVTQITIVLVA